MGPEHARKSGFFCYFNILLHLSARSVFAINSEFPRNFLWGKQKRVMLKVGCHVVTATGGVSPPSGGAKAGACMR